MNKQFNINNLNDLEKITYNILSIVHVEKLQLLEFWEWVRLLWLKTFVKI